MVFDNGSAQGPRYVILLEGCVGSTLETGARPQALVREKVGTRAVVLIGARLGCHFDLN